MPVADRRGGGIVWLAVRERALWIAALLGYGVGDLGTTLIGLSTGRGAEAGPIAAELVAQFGLPALVVLKLSSMATFYLTWRLIDWPFRVAVPLAIAGVGLVVTVWNVIVLLA